MSGRPIECKHCGFQNWPAPGVVTYCEGDQVRTVYRSCCYPDVCGRCGRDFREPVAAEAYETVVINGRHVWRAKT